jgi:uncharacterized spore protein YtfJ
MTLDELIAKAKESLEARMVFAEPYEKDGVIVIPAATITGGGGGGNGRDQNGQEGRGGGFGVIARPAGAFVIKDGNVHWEPAVNVNRLVGTVGLIAVAGLFAGARIARIRAARRVLED